MSTNEARCTLCTTYDAAANAAEELSSSSVLIFHCQGRELGMPDGELSIIALSDPASSHVFLFDRQDITKVVWDGRTYLLEVADTYGVLLHGVIDLQLIEVSTRGTKEKNSRLQHTTRHFRRFIDFGHTLPDDIHKLLGLIHCAGLYHVSEAGDNIRSTALRKGHGSGVWLLRPFPDDLQRRCVENIQLINLLYARFRAKKKQYSQSEKWQEMTTRYMEAYPTRELRAAHASCDLYKFLPLEIMAPSPTNTRRYRCTHCERMLTVASFLQSPSDDDFDEPLQRSPQCRLCRPSPPAASTAGTSYTIITTYEQAAIAAGALARYSTLILDCEGQDFGRPNGVLSILSIGTYPASDTVYLFDVLALQDKDNALLASLLSLLRDPGVGKLVWDGRSDFLELGLTYGVVVEGILDMQLAEVMRRPSYLNNHALAYFSKSKAVMRDLQNNPGLLDGIYRLVGLDHCAGILRVLDALGGKDPAVTNLHRSDGGSMWLNRPLPAMLLDYAARDIYLISRVSDVLLRRVDVEQLRGASARYMRVYPTRELKEAHVPLELSKFVPLDVIEAPPPDALQYRCARCERMLSLSCFATRSAVVEGVEPDETVQDDGASGHWWRWTMCRLCVLIAVRNAEAQMESWGWCMVP
ncbi:ribonuclease H-like domain-containing protein [Cerioporus squamosus]|nr:ribonuclease H-like domain-containing protein [Cerioporus squamosus]